jgi:hypothetical protein
MPHLYVTGKSGASYGWTGKMYYAPPITSAASSANDALFVERSIPANVTPIDAQTSYALFNGSGVSRCYMVGGHTQNMVFTEDFTFLVQGILPPTNELTNVTGTGLKIGFVPSAATGSGMSGEIIFYLSLYDELHGRRSSLSGGSPIITMSSQAITISNLPTTVDDASATHWEVWHSVDGALPALAARVQVGATSFLEEVTNLRLGEVFTTSFGRFPVCKYNVIYHDRQVMAGDPRHPDRLYLSEIGEPEKYAGLWLRTRQGEPITALAVVRDILLVFGPTSTYHVQGYTAADLEMNVVEPHIGCINHHGIVNIHGLLFVPSHLGFYVSTGMSFHFISDHFQDTWKEEYEAYETTYETTAFGVHDPESKVYKFYVGTVDIVNSQFSGQKCYWVLDYTPLIREAGGNFRPPNLSFDARTREDVAASPLATPSSGRSYLYTGTCDGEMRRENLTTGTGSTNDDSDTFVKKFYVRTKHYFWGDPGGAPNEGWFYPTFWLFVTHEVSSGTTSTLDLFVGDEDAYRNVIDVNNTIGGVFQESVPGGKVTQSSGFPSGDTDTLWNRSVWFTRPMISGRGMTVAWTVDSPDNTVAFYGFGGTRRPGGNYRGVRDVEQDLG